MAILSTAVNSENWIKKLRLKQRETFKTNIKLTNQITKNLLAYLGELNLYPLSAYLKIDSISSFHIIFTTTLRDYISEELLKAYDWISETEKRVRNTNYNIDLSFMHEDKNLNIESLNSDGFRFKLKDY